MSDLFNSILAAILGLFGATADTAPQYNGYVEADFVYVAPSAPGRITEIDAHEGATVQAGDTLFKLDELSEKANLRAAEAKVAEAKANLDNLQTGSREDEIAVIRATLDQAQADQELARKTLARSQSLLENALVPQAQVDADRAALNSLNAQVTQIRAQLKVAELPARDAQLVAARAAVSAAEANADSARSALNDRVVTAPSDGMIERVFFDPGEVAATGTPVISILPPTPPKLFFFIPEQDRAAFHLGDTLAMTCDGCPSGLTATITRIASEPQHTPPIIYSREERARLIFRAEARLQEGTTLLPGQPVTLTRP